jgi:hypothetical protein
MLVWSVLTLLGFLVLTAVVIALGTSSTARYEREHNESSPPEADVGNHAQLVPA